MNEVTAKAQHPNQGLMIAAIAVLCVAIGVTGWAIVKMYSGPATASQGSPEDSPVAGMETEILLAIQRKLNLPVIVSNVKAQPAGEIKGEAIYRYTASWRPQLDLYVKGPETNEPATLSPKGLADVFMEWIKQNPEKAKPFMNVPNPLAKFTTLTLVASTSQEIPVAGTIQMVKLGPGGALGMTVSFDTPTLTQGQPAYKFGTHAMPAGSKDYASIAASKQILQESINQGLVEAYRLDMLKGERSANQELLDQANALVDSVKKNPSQGRQAPAGKTGDAGKADKPQTLQEALDDVAKKQAELERLKKAMAEKQAQMERERQEYMAPLLAATRPGHVWIGALTEVRTGANKEEIRIVAPIGVRFITQTENGDFVGVLFDPDAPDVTKAFAGRIVPDPKRNNDWTLTLATAADTGITARNEEDSKGARAWLQKGDSYHLFAKLTSQTEMIGRSSRRAGLSLKLVQETGGAR